MMMKTILLTVAGICLIVFLQSCEYDKEMIIPASASSCPDTSNVSFVANVEPLLRANCFSCHGNGSNEGNVSLDTYDKVKELASSGRLLGAISHSAGFAPMPEGADKLDDCSINAVRVWIEEGTKNN
jgi:hypothetical protein